METVRKVIGMIAERYESFLTAKSESLVFDWTSEVYERDEIALSDLLNERLERRVEFSLVQRGEILAGLRSGGFLSETMRLSMESEINLCWQAIQSRMVSGRVVVQAEPYLLIGQLGVLLWQIPDGVVHRLSLKTIEIVLPKPWIIVAGVLRRR